MQEKQRLAPTQNMVMAPSRRLLVSNQQLKCASIRLVVSTALVVGTLSFSWRKHLLHKGTLFVGHHNAFLHIARRTITTTLMDLSPVETYDNSHSLVGIKSVGVDYGTVRTGVAVTWGYSPRPLIILSDFNSTDLSMEVVRICESEGAQQLILGLPLDKNGTETRQAEKTREFASVLAATCLEYLGPRFSLWFWDERYTSKAASARLQSSNPNADISRALVDADSACIILEDYYSENGKGAERIDVQDQIIKEDCLSKWKDRQERIQLALDAAKAQRAASLDARNEAMKRVMELEAKMAKDGTLASGKKKQKQQKQRKKPKSDWLTL